MAKAAAVPESLLKKRKRADAWAATRQAEAAAKQKKNAAKKDQIFKRAEQYVKEYVDHEKDLIRLKREARANGGYHVPGEARLMFVVRIRGVCDMHPKTRKILQLLRLRQINNGIFLKVNKATLNMLKKVEPYVTFGYPNQKTVRDLIYKRGFGKMGNGRNKDRIPLSNNDVIEEALAKHDVICMEDLVHEIFTVGPAFKEANNFLWPFKLSNPNGGWTRKRNHYVEGGDAGNREEKLNELIQKML